MKIIKLTKGLECIVDDDDYKRLSKYKWCVTGGKGSPYAIRCVNYKLILMHRIIMRAPNRSMLDHINMNTLDNRKCNLRFSNSSKNKQNARVQSNNILGYKGVSKDHNRYKARITLRGKTYNLGFYNTPEEAALAYDSGARELFGEFARTNFE